jgi:hypothetical protein
MLTFSKFVPCHRLLFPSDIFLDIIGYVEGEPVVRECIPALPLSLFRMVYPEFHGWDIEESPDTRSMVLSTYPCIHQDQALEIFGAHYLVVPSRLVYKRVQRSGRKYNETIIEVVLLRETKI